MEETLPAIRTFSIDGRSFMQVGQSAYEILRDGAALAGSLAAGGTILGGAALYVAGAPAVPVSREEAQRLGELERKQYGDPGRVRVDGTPVAMPTPSPFQDKVFVDRLPTQAMIDSEARESSGHATPAPVPGAEPHITPRSEGSSQAPATPLTPRSASDGVFEYGYVDSLSKADGRAALSQIEKCRPPFEQYGSFSALKNNVSFPKGWEVHHIVQQSLTYRFGTEVIQSTSNTIALPDEVHDLVTQRYARKFEDAEGHYFSHYRDYVKALPFEEQRELGIQAINAAIYKANIAPELKEKLRIELHTKERPELCTPNAPLQMSVPQIPGLDDLQRRIDSHNEQSDRPIPDARSVARWDGTTRSGTLIDLGEGQVAQHLGRGAYAVADVTRDLNGVNPPIGQFATLSRNGQIITPQVPSLDRGLT